MGGDSQWLAQGTQASLTEKGSLRTPHYLSDLQHLGVESVQVQDELRKADERELDGAHLPEGPVVGGAGDGVQGPLLQHAAGHHVALHLLEDVSQDLQRRTRPRLSHSISLPQTETLKLIPRAAPAELLLLANARAASWSGPGTYGLLGFPPGSTSPAPGSDGAAHTEAFIHDQA